MTTSASPAAAAAAGGRSPVVADRARRTVLSALLGSGAAAALAGCVDLSDSGPVVGGRPVGGVSNPIRITVYTRGPARDAGPQAIVEGFLEACAIPGPDYSTARSYLAGEAHRRWDPAASVTVYDGTKLTVTPGPVRVAPAARRAAGVGSAGGATTGGRGRQAATATPDPGRPAVGHPVLPLRASPRPSTAAGPVRRTTVRVQAPAVGGVDRRGGWSNATADTFTHAFHLVTVAGQWRIDRTAPGLVVSADDFARVWPPYRLYFPAPAGDVLVPDLVFLPDRGQAVSQLVSALLAGPSPWLAPVVTRPLPPGVRLGGAGVQLTNAGLVTVDLADVPRLTAGAATLLAAQVAQTVQQVSSSVTDVAVTTDGSPLTIAGIPARRSVAYWQHYSADVLPTTAAGVDDLVVLRSGPGQVGTVLLRGTPGSLHPVPLPASVARRPRPAWVAVDPVGSRLLFVDPAQQRLVAVSAPAPDASVRQLAVGTKMARPQLDHQGLGWLVDFPGGPGGRVRVFGPDGSVAGVSVDTRALARSVVRRVVLARDGQRAAVVLRSGAGELLALTRVLRGGTVRLDRSVPVLGPVGQILDVAWADAATLVVLQRGADGAVSVVTVDSDGSDLISLSRPARDSISVTAGPDNRPALVGTVSGQLLAQQDTPRWTRADVGFAPVFPG